MNIRPLQAGDVERLDTQLIDRWALGEIPDMARWHGSALTVVDDDDRPVGIAGLSCEGGVGTGWMIGSKQLRARPVYLHRTMKQVLCHLLSNSPLQSIQAVAETSGAARWLERLGFHSVSKDAGRALYVLARGSS